MRDYNKNRKPFHKGNKGGEGQPKSHSATAPPDKFPNQEAVQAKPLEVVVYGNFEKALKLFRSKVQKERVLSNFKEKQRFEKPSDKKRRKKNEAIRKQISDALPTPKRENKQHKRN